MSQIYLFKDRDIHVGNSGTRRDPWDSFPGLQDGTAESCFPEPSGAHG